MAAIFRVRDPFGRTVIDENMLMCRYLTQVVIPWNDQSEHTVQHAGFLAGTPFYNVYNPNRHSLNLASPILGNASHIQCTFSADTAIIKQVWSVSSQFNYVGRGDLVVYLGVMG